MVQKGKVKGKRAAEESAKSLPWVPVLLIAALILVGVLVIQNRPGADGGLPSTNGTTGPPPLGPLNSEHTHSRWAFLVDGEDIVPVHFAKFAYQVRTSNVHMEGGNTELHKHATGITIGRFFASLDILFDGRQFQWPREGLRFVANETHGFRLFANGREVTHLGSRLDWFEPAGSIESPATDTWCLQFGPLNESPCATYQPRSWPVAG